MAELINKKDALAIVKSAPFEEEFTKSVTVGCIEELPTTTEAEIRAKAIDRFMKEIEAEYDNDACPNVTDYLDYKISLRDLFRIADELKGGAD